MDFTSVYATDMDGDGDADVLGAAYGGHSINWWENRLGDPTPWIEHTVRADLDGARSVYASDVDGDGDVDVLGAAMLADSITWWENWPGYKTDVPLALKNYGP
ncbi:MAG: FG-GAP-like repeat-containing protein [Anaerolineae bacterium]